MYNAIIWITVIMIAVFVIFFVIAYSIENKKLEQLQRYWDVKIGMSEAEMLAIMGDGFNRSLLKNNLVKYEWRINASSYGSSYKGVSIKSYSGVKKVTIYTKNGFVEEVRPYNV